MSPDARKSVERSSDVTVDRQGLERAMRIFANDLEGRFGESAEIGGLLIAALVWTPDGDRIEWAAHGSVGGGEEIPASEALVETLASEVLRTVRERGQGG